MRIKKSKKKNFIHKYLQAIILFFLIIGIVSVFNVEEIQKNINKISIENKEYKESESTTKSNSEKAINNNSNEKTTSTENNNSSVQNKVYLSDLNYITDNNWTYNGWAGHNVEHDKNQDGGKLSLMIDGRLIYFTKGISIHAKGQATYDISELSTKYPRFIANIGVDGARGSNGNLWIKISISKDGITWEDKIKTSNMNGKTPAVEVDIDVEEYKYLRFYVDPIGSNGADHATIAGASLVTKDFDKTAPFYNKLQSVTYYDNMLKNYSVEENYSQNYQLVLKRELVNKLGYSTIQEFAELNKNGIKTLDWYIAKDERIEQIIEVGEISNTPKFLEILADLYTQNENDFNSNNRLIYTKMAVALAATYTTDALHSPLRFGGFAATYDYIERYSLMKQLFDENKFMHIENNTREGNFIPNNWFENLHIELIRMIMNDNIYPEEIIWLNEYTHNKKTLNEFMIPYIHPNYNQVKLYDEANRDTYNSKYFLNQYNIPYADGTQRLWMVLEAGGICWNQSRFGQTMYHINGIPAVGAYQPSHEMYFSYAEDDAGNGYWMERYGNYNDAGTKWYGGNRYRLIFDWGNKSFTEQNINDSQSGTSLGYLYLAQANLNNYEKYKKSLYYNLIANSYGDNNKKIETYFKALEANTINLDSYDYIIKLYKQMSNQNEGGIITSDDWYKLSLKITESYKYYPVAMYDLLKEIRPYLEGEKKLNIDAIEKRNLKEAVNVSNETLASIGAVNAGSGVRTHAKRLLGLAQPDPMSFSFDGENARKIVKNPIYALNWAYSLDGGVTYSDWTEGDYITLTQEEIESITSQNDIIIKFMGLKDYTFTIDIIEGTLPKNIYPNDLENQVIGATDTMEWKIAESETWTSFKDSLPDLTGDKTVEVRTSFTERTIPSATEKYEFTLDNQPDTAKYIPIKNLSIHSYSTQSHDAGRPFYAPNAIDGNMKTLWHTDFSKDVRKDSVYPFIVIKLDSPRNISALEFAQIKYKNNDPDYIKDAIVYVSTDGEGWIEAGKIEGCSQENKLRRINFDQSVYGEYVKVEMVTYSMFSSLAMINLYEDTTVKTIGTFSFDGTDAGKIVLIDEFKGKTWEYSLDSGTTWKEVDGDEKVLSEDELLRINEKDKIKIRIIEDNIESMINIHKQKTPTMPNNVYLNDLENRLIGLSDIKNLEWKIDNGKWNSYTEEEPVVTGTKKLYIRNKATGNTIASDVLEYQFTEDNQPDKAKYIPIKHLKIHDFSSETVRTGNQEQAVKAIDGNAKTKWHSSRTSTTDEKYISIKLDEPRYISKIEYNKETGYIYGVPKDGIVYTSMNGIEWQEVLVFKDLYNPNSKEELRADVNKKDIILNESILAQYVKIKVTTSCDYVNGARDGVPYNYFFSSTMLNLFEDTTKNTKVPPTAEIQYSTTKITNKNVEVTLINPSKEITITNNDGKSTYTFTENGTFTFEFVDKNGNKGTTEAKVDWIDKEDIHADIAYNINKTTNRDVTATIAFNKENVTVKGGNTHIFTENGKYIFEYEDAAGNKGTAEAKVDWIDKIVPEATIKYSTKKPTNQDVTATITFNEDNVTVKGGKSYTFTENGTYIFEYEDVAGNKGTTEAKVDWIDRTIPRATIAYNITNHTNQNVIATVTFDKENVTVKGGNTHIFTENGTYTFEFVGPAGNVGTVTAKVDWIDKKIPVTTINYSTKHPTNQNVTATITADEEVTITNNNGQNTYTFTENGKFMFEFVDKAGNKGTTEAKVDWIDRKLPKATITYDVTNLTNKDVIATVTFDKENVTVKGGNTHIFTENGEYEFEFVGPAGNTGTIIAKVDWIDKKVPEATVTYNNINKTNEDVVATVTFDKENVTVKGGNTHTFTDNGEYIFEYEDAAGNKGIAIAIVSWIDKIAPTTEVTYSTTKLTNKDVIATIVFDKEVSFLTEGIYGEELPNNTYKIKITDNINFTLEYVDILGNKGTTKIKVDWIDKTAPTAAVKYNQTTLTNENVVATLINASEDITITNNEGKDTYTFEENGEFIFEFVDKAGNKGTATAKVSNIDKTATVVKIEYSTTSPTNKDVVATLITDSEIKITNNDGKATYIFTENGEFTFEFIDKFGNERTITATVNNIDKVTPKVTLISDIVTPTNKNVVVKLINPSEKITITNNDGKDTYTFKKNGTFTFEFLDKAGNKGTATATVSNIDKKAPTAEISYSTTDSTNKDVIATLINASEDITITNNDGKNTYIFAKNGTFTFEFVDKAGNKGTTEAVVNNINKNAPTAEISYSTTEMTNQDVIVTLVNQNKPITVTNNNGSTSYTFTENGEFTFEFVDKTGNKGTATATVSNIDKTVPTAQIGYSMTNPTNQNVIATLTDISEEIIITNNNGQNIYTFTENGEFTFEFVDKAGNKGIATATVTNIDKIIPTATIEYSTTRPTNQNVVATITADEDITITNNTGQNKYTFTENGEFIFEFIDKAGNKGTATATVTNIDKTLPIAEVTYNITSLTNENVTVMINFNKENVKITNNAGQNTYTFTENSDFTFEYIDEAGNTGVVATKVDWIDKIAPTAIINYSINHKTNKSVVATITPSEEVTITNNDGQNNYTFTENGEFIFEFIDKAGNKGIVTATVTWISEEVEDLDKTDSHTTAKPNQTETSSIQNVGKTENKNSTSNQLEKEKKDYSVKNISVSIATNQELKDTHIKYNKLILPKKLKKDLGKNSEYFELILLNKNNERIELKSYSDITIKIKLDSKKKFDEMYVVKENNKVEKMNYKYDGKDNIIVKVNKLDKYVISYEEKKIKKAEASQSSTLYAIILVLIIVLLVILTSIIKKFQEHKGTKK